MARLHRPLRFPMLPLAPSMSSDLRKNTRVTSIEPLRGIQSRRVARADEVPGLSDSLTTAGEKPSLGVPDWTLRMPRAFTTSVPRSVTHGAADKIEATHAHLRCW